MTIKNISSGTGRKYFKKFLLLSLSVIVLTTFVSNNIGDLCAMSSDKMWLTKHGETKIVFRYDDFQLIPSWLSDSLLNIFQKNNVPLCIGIIPFDRSGSFINELKSEQINDLRSRIQKNEIEVALHGFNHLNNLKASFLSKATYSEFATVNFEKQYEKLAKGKNTLDTLLKTNTRVFVPPFNTYDNNTIRGLEDLGFEIISGTMQGTSNSDLIKYIPVTYEDFSELPEIIKKYKNDDVTIILYFHPYTFKGGSSEYSNNLSELISIDQLDTLLNWTKKQNVSFYTFSELAKTENFNRVLFKANSLKYNLLKKILNKLKLYRYGVYSTLEFHKWNVGLIIGNILLHLLSFIFVYYVIYFLIKILHHGLKLVLILMGICSVPLLIYLFYIRNDFSFGIILILLMVNLTALILSIKRAYKPSRKYF